MTILDQLNDIKHDAIAFIQRLWIISKEGKRIRFILSPEQLELLNSLLAGDNIVVAKSRQVGITTLCTAYLFWKAFTSKDSISCVSLLHKMDSATEIFLKYKNYYYSLPTVLRMSLQKETSSCMRFQNGSAINAITAGGEGGLRSFTINLLHISELCYYQDPEEVLATALAALNGNQVVIESTARSFGDPVHQLIERMNRGELVGRWRLLFFPWHKHSEYSLQAPEDFLPTEDEKVLISKYNLNLNQLYWRRTKISEIGYVKFLTEFPGCLEDIFSQKGDCYYSDKDLTHCNIIPTSAIEEWYITNPVPGEQYAIGVDVASGVAKDYSVIYVLSQKTSRPVYIYSSNKIAPTMLASKIYHVSTAYNKARAAVESNNYGHAVILQLEHLGFSNFWKANGKHWETTTKSKVVMHEALKEAIVKNEIDTLDELTVIELKSLLVNKEGLAPQSTRTRNGHGDRVIALALAYQVLISLPNFKRPTFNPLKQFKKNSNNPFATTIG